MINIEKKEQIKIIDIANELRKSFYQYSTSVIIGRALPDIRDGLKPVHRRILYAMYNEGLLANKKFSKCAGVVGEVLKKFHPHGDNSVYSALVRMAQPWQTNILLIQGQGNFGSIDGDPPAAYRYTEARLSYFAEEILRDISFETIDYIANFDGTTKEPVVLPSRVPNLLINGSEGIAVAMVTHCPPHNLSEIINAIIAIIDEVLGVGPYIDTKALFRIVPAPDFPTKGIIDNNNYLKVILNGYGSIAIRAEYYINDNKDFQSIIITSIPYQVNKSKLIENIFNLVNNKIILDICNIRDESDKDGLRIVLDLVSAANSNVVINHLFKKTGMQLNYNINFLTIVDKEAKVLPLRNILEAFINFRRIIINKKMKFLIKNYLKQLHIFFGLIIALDNIDNILKIIRSAKDKKVIEDIMIKKAYASISMQNKILIYKNMEKDLNIYNIKNMKDNFFLSKDQIHAILNMKLSTLISMEKEILINKTIDIFQKVKDLNYILSTPLALMNLIKSDLLDIEKKYKYERNSKIAEEPFSFDYAKDFISNKEIIITISENGYIYSTFTDNYKTQYRGGKGKKNLIIDSNKDKLIFAFVTSTHSTILFFTNKGQMFRIKTHAIINLIKTKRGIQINNLFNIRKEENICSAISINENENENKFIITCSRKGKIKKTKLISYLKARNSSLIGVVIKDDELVSVKVSTGSNDVIVATSIGYSIRFIEEEIKIMNRKATGYKCIKLSSKDYVCDFEVIEKEVSESFLLNITSGGYGKQTKLNDYKIQKKRGRGIISIKLNNSIGNLVAFLQVTKIDEIIIITNIGRIIRLSSRDISIYKRYSKGVKIISLDLTKNEKVIACRKLKIN